MGFVRFLQKLNILSLGIRRRFLPMEWAKIVVLFVEGVFVVVKKNRDFLWSFSVLRGGGYDLYGMVFGVWW